MSSEEIRKKFRDFFERREHKWVSSSSLIPDDPSVLLTTAGMQQFKPYYIGKADPMKDFGSKNTASIQKSFRTSDIDEVGDESHLTFFEMLGNFSFGGYFKDKAIEYGYEFITKEMGLPVDYVSVFEGNSEVPADTESEKIWKSLGVKDIRKFGRKDNFWGPTGAEGPCGPTTEIYVKNCEGRSIEIWNIVFNEYYQHADKRLEKLKTPGVDTGMGLERLAMVSQNVPTIFETDLFGYLMQGFPDKLPVRVRRIIADHIRAVAFLISDGLRPSNKEAGYILRRLMRRIVAFTYEENIGVDPVRLLEMTVSTYKTLPDYQNLDFVVMKKVFGEEYDKFMTTLGSGRKEFEKEATKVKAQGGRFLPRLFVFGAHQSTGVTIDVLDDFARKEGVEIDKKAFAEDMERHREVSRAGQEKKFGGHGLILNTGELKAGSEEELKKVLRLHTATHLLQQALREVLGKEVQQRGSDITAERTRFDFSFPRKMTAEEIEKTEKVINQKIKEDLPVSFVELPKAEAEKVGALYFFKEKYPNEVKVYFIGKSLDTAWSKEFCGGPHVKRTGEIGKFKITKEEAVGSGTRRIRGMVE